MKSEISRDSHQSEKRYSGVYQQQGRMLTDSDWNELVDILKQRLNQALRHVVGGNNSSVGGTPRHRALRVVDEGASGFEIQPGHVYIDGIAAQFPGDTNIAYDQQADFPAAPPLPADDYVLYADVWERSVTQLMDERLRDKGLHGADTCTRKQTLAQIKWSPYDKAAPDNPHNDPETSDLNPFRGDARLSATLLHKTTETDPCDPCAAELDVEARIGNYLFRVEVHAVDGVADNPDGITLKWSSENGAEQFAALPTQEEMPAGFISDQWSYEFFDETSEKQLGVHLENTSWEPVRGVMTEIKEPGSPYNVPTLAGSNETQIFVRRWDGYCTLDLAAKTLIDGVDRNVDLSTGNQAGSLGFVKIGDTLSIVLDSIKLELELKDKSFVAGDYWLAEVREAEHDPLDSDKSKLIVNQGPRGIEHRYLTLGLFTDNSLQPNPEFDRKYAFPPLTEMTRLFMAGGDGQEVMPGQPLPQHLCVGVANGEWPVTGATVRFQIEEGGGSLSPVSGGSPSPEINVETSADGIARCEWSPDAVIGAKCRVRATLVDSDHAGDASRDLVPPVFFYANLISAEQVAYAPGCEPALADTVHNLMTGDALLALGGDNYYSVQDILDALLCKLRARHIPYDPTNVTRWQDVNLEEGGVTPVTVQQAIDALLENLHSEDIKYTPACAGDTPPTVRSGLAIPTATSSRVHEILDKLLCEFKATHLPLDKTDAGLCALLKDNAQVQTVQDAIKLLCERGADGGCCTITIFPGDDIEAMLATIADGQDAHVCISQGEYKVARPVVLKNKGHIVIQGCGSNTRVLAPLSESVFLFINCKSAMVRDINLQNGKAGSKGNFQHMSGTLGMQDVERVTVDGVALFCPAAGERSASCLTIAYGSPAGKNASIRVSRSQLNPGHQQLGLLLLNAGRAQIEDNEIRVRTKSTHWILREQLKFMSYRKAFRRMLISNLAFAEAGSTPHKSRNVVLNYEKFTLHFATDKSLVTAWPKYVAKNPPLPGLQQREWIRYLKDSADKILLSQGNVTGTGLFKTWYQEMQSFLPAIAKQGIVCAGTAAADIRILNNTICGVAQGIHVGLSHNQAKDFSPDSAGRVRISGNQVVTYLSAENYGGRHGIYVGNCDSLDIDCNHLQVERYPTDIKRPIDGVRVYGELGAMLQIRHNHTNGFDTGVYIRATNASFSASHLWQISSNMCAGAAQAVDLEPSQQFLPEHNIP